MPPASTQPTRLYRAGTRIGGTVGPTPFQAAQSVDWTLEVGSNNAQLGLQYPEPPGIGMTTIDGQKGGWTLCGNTYATCPPPNQPNDGVLVKHHASTRPGSLMELTSTGVDYGEVSILMAQGAYAFGNDIASASSMGKHAVWTFGTMNSFFGDGPVGANFGNNAFFLYNAGFGSSSAADPAVTNPDFESGTTGWSGSGSTAAQSSAQAYSGTHSLLQTGVGDVTQTVSGLTAGTTYQVNAWSFGTAGANSHIQIHVDDGAGANAGDSYPIALGQQWQLISVPFTATSTGNVKIYLRLGDDPGAAGVFWDAVSVTTPIGSFPFAVSAQTGMVRANYGFYAGSGQCQLFQRRRYGQS